MKASGAEQGCGDCKEGKMFYPSPRRPGEGWRCYTFGCGTIRMEGFGAFQPCGYCFLASSSVTEPAMITSSPCFPFTGVATLCVAVSWSESTTRSTSSKLRPVVIG